MQGQINEDVTYDYAPGGEDGLVMGRPLNLEDLVLVGLETMQLQL
jgi:hypothetical protein